MGGKVGGAGSPSNTMSPGPRLICMPSFIFDPAVWPQYTNVTDGTGQAGQRSDSVGRTVSQTVAQPDEIAKLGFFVIVLFKTETFSIFMDGTYSLHYRYSPRVSCCRSNSLTVNCSA